MSDQPYRISVIDMHTSGEPVRIVVDGYPRLHGDDILAKRREARDRHDHLRRALMLEPRGHAGMYGVIPVEPSDPSAALGALFTHNEGYSTMCGHATIALGKWLIESGRVATPEFRLELPCGLVDVVASVRDGTVVSTAFTSVPSFLATPDVELDVPNVGRVCGDLAYGGAYYLIVASSALGRDFFTTPLPELVELGAAITEAGRAALDIRHPGAADLGFLYGTILTDDAAPTADSYNLCIFADAQIDRSPTGSGVTARMARDHARGLIAEGVERRFIGAGGMPFLARIVGTADEPPRSVRVLVGGQASYCGTATFELHPDDPMRYGFRLPASFAEVASREIRA